MGSVIDFRCRNPTAESLQTPIPLVLAVALAVRLRLAGVVELAVLVIDVNLRQVGD